MGWRIRSQMTLGGPGCRLSESGVASGSFWAPPFAQRRLKESMKMSTQEVGYVPFIMEGTARLLALRSSRKFSVRINYFLVYLIFSHKKFKEDDEVSGAWQTRACNRFFLRVSKTS